MHSPKDQQPRFGRWLTALVWLVLSCAPKNKDHSDVRSAAPEAPASDASTTPADDAGETDAGDFHASQPPTEISGVNLVELDYDNARVSCNFTQASSKTTTVDCAAVAALPDGSQVLPNTIKKGVALSWTPPKLVEGVATTNCAVSPDTLRFTCSVAQAPSSPLAKLQYDLQVSDTGHAAPRTETTFVVLPYSVGVSAGLVPAIPFAYDTGDKSKTGFGLTDSPPTKRGMQLLSIPASAFRTSRSYEEICVIGDNVFFQSDTIIYKLAGDKVEFFAGSPPITTEGNVSELFGGDSRFDAGVFGAMTCNANGTIFSSGLLTITSISTTGKPTILMRFPRKKGQKRPLLATNSSGALIYLDPIDLALKRLGPAALAAPSPTPEVVVLGPATNNLLTDATKPTNALAFADDGKIYRTFKDVPMLRIISPDKTYDLPLAPGFAPLKLVIYGGKLLIGGTRLAKAELYQLGSDDKLTPLEFTTDDPHFEHWVNGLTTDKSGALLLSTGGGMYRMTAGVFKQLMPEAGTAGFCDKPREALSTVLSGIKYLTASASGAWYFDAENGRFAEIFVDKGKAFVANRYVEEKDGKCQNALQDITTWLQGRFSVTADKSLVVPNYGDNFIQKISPDGTISRLAGCGDDDPNDCDADPTDGMPADGAPVTSPIDALATDAGIFFMTQGSAATPKSDQLFQIRTDGTLYRLAGDRHGLGLDPKDTTVARDAKLEITSFARSPDGAIFLASFDGNQIFKIDTDGTLALIAGTTEAMPLTGNDIPALHAALGGPSQLSVTNDGTVYFIDGINPAVVRRLDPDPALGVNGYRVSTFFGGSNLSFCGTGSLGGTAATGSLLDAVQASLGVLCAGDPTSIAIFDTCPAAGGKTRILIGQEFSFDSNIIEVATGCRTNN